MRRPIVLLAVLLVPVAIGVGWTGDERLPLPAPGATMTAVRVSLDPQDTARRQVGALTWLGGVALTSGDRAFGGFSSLVVAGDRFTLLSDGGTVLRFRMGDDWRPRDVRTTALPAGPGTGWRKSDRDAESLAVDPRTGTVWAGFEAFNQIWRYAPGFAGVEGSVAPAAMARWPINGGIESFTRLADGHFVAISESREPGGMRSGRTGLVWGGDPVRGPVPAFRFIYRPTPGYDPADMAELPDGRLLVLERRFALPFVWSNRLMIVPREEVRAGATIGGRLLATLAPPLIHDNIEGVAVTREVDATIVWLVSDDNQLPIQRSLLLKFRLNG